ncbi:holo-ACP synthase [Bacillaceae bacterium IKA-2]|nr:holo-ACP synthase [Bacillaceae bacterium IKA-2]
MITGLGIDIVELQRISEAINRNSNFVKRILTETERSYFDKLTKRRKVEFLAGRFAAKEAFVKAAGTGIGRNYSWQDIEIIPDENGKPLLQTKRELGRIQLSISHSREYAVANVIIENSD